MGENYISCQVEKGSINISEEVIAGVVTGMVSRAVRDTEKDGVSVREGDFIGFAGDTIYVSSVSRNETAARLCESNGAQNFDIMLLIRGADASDEESVIPLITKESYGALVADGVVSGGMLLPLQGLLADKIGILNSYTLTILLFAYLFTYAVVLSRPRKRCVR